jgi:uncharacterized protein (TIGR02453 family)
MSPIYLAEKQRGNVKLPAEKDSIMIAQTTLTFFSSLAANNNKAWFDANRDDYFAAKEDFEKLTGNMLEALARQEPAFTGQKAKDCIFRIFRDVRFAKDKTPYKSHFGAYFSKGGKKYPGAGYYLHIEPGNSFAGGGLWSPEGPVLKAVRQEIDYQFDDFRRIIGNKGFKKAFTQINGEQLKTLPQGYAADDPAIEYLKMKSFTVSHKLTDKEVCAKGLVEKCAGLFQEMKPLIDFLNRAVD